MIITTLILAIGATGCNTIKNENSSSYYKTSNKFVNLKGELYWKYKTNAEILSPSVFYNNNIFVISKDNHLYSLSAKEGLLNWKYKADSAISNSTPIISDKNVYIGTENGKIIAADINSVRKPMELSNKSGLIFHPCN
ncbi:MAG: PQQ-like beta-propeller repeat protein [Bacillus subtilis]|nr:PQQ-like beta-propeller repeat protein [Bacillus subtilis]